MTETGNNNRVSQEAGTGPLSGNPCGGRRDDPWLNWLAAVGIAHGFPNLHELRRPAPERNELGNEVPTDDSKRWFLNRPHLMALNEIYQALRSARAIVTRPGQGATTLSRYLYMMAENHTLIRSSIPVLISLEDVIAEPYEDLMLRAQEAIVDARTRSTRYPFAPPAYDPSAQLREEEKAERDAYDDEMQQFKDEADDLASEVFKGINSARLRSLIEESIQTAVVRSLVTQAWELAMPRPAYRDILNAKSPQTQHLVEQRNALARYVSREPLSKAQKAVLAEAAPRLVPKDTRTLLAELNKYCGVRISLILDLSATPLGRFYLGEDEGEYLTEAYRSVLGRVASAIKNIEQSGASQPIPTLPSLLDKTYVMSDEAWIEFSKAETRQEDEVIAFPALRPIDLFAMLAHHYPTHQDESGRRAEALAAVVDSRFVQITDRRAISTEIALMLAELRRVVELSGEASYQLSSQTAPVQRLTSAILNAISQMEEPAPPGSLQDLLLQEMTKVATEFGYGKSESKGPR